MEEMTETLQTRLTPSQLREVQGAADALGLSRAAFLRVAALEKARREVAR